MAMVARDLEYPRRSLIGVDMNRCTLQWIIWAVVMIAFTALALSGRWTELGLALIITGALWYTLVPQRQVR